MTNEKRLQFDLDEWITSFADMTPHLRACMMIAYEKGRQQERNKALDLVMEEADRINEPYLYMEDLKAIISELKGNKPATDKLSPEYLEQFKQAQADNPNLHLYFGDKEGE